MLLKPTPRLVNFFYDIKKKINMSFESEINRWNWKLLLEWIYQSKFRQWGIKVGKVKGISSNFAMIDLLCFHDLGGKLANGLYATYIRIYAVTCPLLFLSMLFILLSMERPIRIRFAWHLPLSADCLSEKFPFKFSDYFLRVHSLGLLTSPLILALILHCHCRHRRRLLLTLALALALALMLAKQSKKD